MNLATPALTASRTTHEKYAYAQQVKLALARQHPSFFNEYVLRHERTGKPVEQGPVHDEWQEVLSREDRCVLWAHVEAGKTNQISIGRTLYEVGRNPNLRVVIVSNTNDFAKKIVRACGQYITKSAELRAVFPYLRKPRDQSLPWNSTMLTVERDVYAKDPTIQACGVHGAITGSRIDLLVLDDVLRYENTRTEAQREDLWRWVQSTLFGRMTDDSRVWVVGNAWHPRDLMHRLVQLPRFLGHRYPVLDEHGQSTWPSVWPMPRIEKARLDMGPLEFGRQLMCLARDDEDAAFKREWIDEGRKRGRGYQLVPRIDVLPEGFEVVHGVDLASRKTESADLTVIFTVLLHPDGTRQVLNVRAQRLTGPEIVQAIDETHAAYGGTFLVENNAAQEYILQFSAGLTTADLRPFTTGRNKADPVFGVQSIGAELAAGKWIIPCGRDEAMTMAPEVNAWVQEMLFYSPRTHTGDRLMASWFAREMCRRIEAARARDKHGSVGVRVI